MRWPSPAGSGCWPWPTRSWPPPPSSWRWCACSGVPPRARILVIAGLALLTLAALVRQLPDARSLCRAPDPRRGDAGLRLGEPAPGRAPGPDRRSTWRRSPSTSRTSCSPSRWPARRCCCRRAGRSGAAGWPASACQCRRRSLLLLAIGWLGFGEASLTPRGPPFLLARSWEDGPARSYLAAACPEAGWAICAELDRLAPTAQEFLWRQDDSYWSMEPATRAAVRAEEKAILLRAVLADPSASCAPSLANADPPARPVRARRFRARARCGGDAPRTTPSSICRGHPPPSGASAASRATIYVTTVVALLAVIVCVAVGRRGRSGAPLALFVLAAMALNAVICGVLVRSAPTLSGPRRLAAAAPGRRAAARLRAGGQPISRSACATSSLISTSSRRSAPSRRFTSGDAARGAALVAGGRGSAAGAADAGSSPWPGRVRRARSSFCAPLIV